MLSFPTDERPPRIDKPHLKADGRTIVWLGPTGYREGFAEDGEQFAVAERLKPYVAEQFKRYRETLHKLGLD